MLSDEGGNPLAEVGLALSMAFFSLMILMLVAVLNSPPTNQQIKMGNDGTSPTSEKMDLFVYSGGQLYNKDLTRLNVSALPADQKILLAVDPQLELSAVLEIVGKVGHQNLQITKLDAAWQARLKSKRASQ
jgi:hypothetical protein